MKRVTVSHLTAHSCPPNKRRCYLLGSLSFPSDGQNHYYYLPSRIKHKRRWHSAEIPRNGDKLGVVTGLKSHQVRLLSLQWAVWGGPDLPYHHLLRRIAVPNHHPVHR